MRIKEIFRAGYVRQDGFAKFGWGGEGHGGGWGGAHGAEATAAAGVIGITAPATAPDAHRSSPAKADIYKGSAS